MNLLRAIVAQTAVIVGGWRSCSNKPWRTSIGNSGARYFV
jgi:hypothetical protein